ncbi:Ig-like domain-containing protein [Candidatus Palauibacter sp.]|uniref:Ig-like domain-containing protein n=1 Tax=Candidatus Palauibacter sp. TaxID=3101350 RepID=UPI003B01D7E7
MAGVVIAACGDGGTTDPPPDPPPSNRAPVATGSIPPQSLIERQTADVDASAYFSDPDGDALNFAAAASDPNVAGVSVSGSTVAVSAAGAGRATVTVTARDPGGLSAEQGFAVTVAAPEPTTVDVTPEAASLAALGETVQLSADVRDQIGRPLPDAALSWSSADTTVVTVDTAGLVTATGSGSTTVTATAGSASGDARLSVMQSVHAVIVSPAADTIAPRDTLRLTAAATDRQGNMVDGVEFEWRSSDAFVATVDATGLVLGRREGTVTITATGGGASGTSEITVVNPDRGILTAFYKATGGDRWENSENWLTDAPLNDWYGVSTALGRVYSISLEANGLEGRLPPEIGDLSQLQSLVLSRNNLSGPLPPGIGRLGNLVQIYLLSNKLSGPLPPELGKLTELNQLELSWNALSGPIPPELGDLANLRWLSLTSNQLSGPIPPELGNLSRLSVLELGWNSLSGLISEELGSLASLRDLDLSQNDLVGPIPEEFGDLTQLTSLELSGNDLPGPFPALVTRLANLHTLDLRATGLTGPIPADLAGLPYLSFLDLAGNDLSGPIPPELGNVPRFDWLDLGGNELTGPIPPTLGNLRQLRLLRLNRNQLEGSIPSELGRLGSLIWLYLSSNDLTGVIPPELGDLANLTHLSLDMNELTGSIPSELANMPSLRVLDLKENRLSGPIPSQLGTLPRLDWLVLHDNELTGVIPPELGDLAGMRRLYLERNDLSGLIPPEFGTLARLERLSVTGNPEMSGPLPATLTGLGRLHTLMADGTDLCAPPEIEDWLRSVSTQRVASCAERGTSMAYLIQATQSREYPVALVANEEALLRVFVTAPEAGGTEIPPVRAHFYLNGEETYVADIPKQSNPIRAEVDESDLAASANATVPAHVIQPGLEMVMEIDPEGALPPGLGVVRRIPENGRLPVDVESLPTLDLTLIPFLWATDPDSAIIEVVSKIAAAPESHDLLWATRTLLPVSDLAVTAHEPVLTSSNHTYSVYSETWMVRRLEGASGHYMGMMSGPVLSPPGGGAWRGRYGFALPETESIAHTLGGNFGMSGGACGAAYDPSYPYPNGSAGSWGYDSRDGGALVPPTTPDLMFDCDADRWISDFNFATAVRHRAAEGAAARNSAAPVPSLLLWGGVDAEGTLYLDPAFVIDAPPALPQRGGEYEITGRNEEGGELFSLGFEMRESSQGDGGSPFLFLLPIQPEWRHDLASLTLAGPGGRVTIDGDTDQPMAILRNPLTGQIRAILRDLSPPVLAQVRAAVDLAAGPGLDVLTSRGIPDLDAWRR